MSGADGREEENDTNAKTKREGVDEGWRSAEPDVKEELHGELLDCSVDETENVLVLHTTNGIFRLEVTEGGGAELRRVLEEELARRDLEEGQDSSIA